MVDVKVRGVLSRRRSPVIVHHRNQQADLVYVFRGNVENDGFVVDGIQSIPLGGGLSFLQPPPLTH